MRVYLVEDSVSLQERLAGLIQSSPGLDLCGQADSAAMAIEDIRRLQPDAVVLDLQLREGTGWEVLAATSGLPGGPRFVVLTNHGEQEFRRRAEQWGVERFFDKSFEFDAFLEALAAGLPRRKRNDTN